MVAPRASAAPAGRATPIASATSPAAPRAEPAFPPRSRVAATTGAAIGVLTVATSGDSPRSAADVLRSPANVH